MRKCKYCGCGLSRYNQNNYCFAHMSIGADLAYKKEKEKRYKQFKRAKAQAAARRQRKKAGEAQEVHQ